MKTNILFSSKTLFVKIALLTALVLGGGNFAWGDTVTESFEYATDGKTEISVNTGNKSLSNGWTVIGDGTIGTSWGTNYRLHTSQKRTGTYSLYGGNYTKWIVCPVLASGTLSFYAYRNDPNGYVTVGIASKSGDVFSISNENLQTTSFNSNDFKNQWGEISVDLGSDPVYFALLVNYGWVDDVTYTPYEETPAEVTLSISPDEDVNFGTVWANATKTDYYTITNNSEKTVNVVAAISGTDAASFSVSPSEAQNIATGGTQTYSISYTYDSSSLGKKSATITFTPDEDGTNTITKNISVTAVSNFTISSVDGAFGNVTADANKVYTITNNTGSTVTVTPSVDGSNMFSVSPNVATEIADGSSLDFTVSFDWEPDLAKFGEKTATISFTPDNDDDPFVISASATSTADVILDETQATTWSSGSGKSVLIKYQPQNGWNTIILPFPTSSNINSIFGTGAVIYKLDSYSDDGIIAFKKNTAYASSYVGHNIPCLIYKENAQDNSSGVLLTGVYVFLASSATPGSTSMTNSNSQTATFKGTFAPIEAPGMDGKYGITSTGKLGKGSSYASIKGFRAYLELSAGASARVIMIDDDSETTDLGFVKMVDPEAKDVYNLQGQKVKKSGKGIYVVNGRKVVIK